MSETTSTTLQQQIENDLKQAMRDRDEVKKMALRAAKTVLLEASTAGAKHALSEDQALEAIRKLVKRRRDTAAEYEKLGAADKAVAELADAAVLERYLPRQLSESEIEVAVKAVIAQTQAASIKEMGKVMSAVMAQLGGKADGKLVNQVVRRHLGGN